MFLQVTLYTDNTNNCISFLFASKSKACLYFFHLNPFWLLSKFELRADSTPFNLAIALISNIQSVNCSCCLPYPLKTGSLITLLNSSLSMISSWIYLIIFVFLFSFLNAHHLIRFLFGDLLFCPIFNQILILLIW